MTSWKWVAAACRGVSHVRSGTRMQDAHACRVVGSENEIFFSVVSDGAGSASFGGQGASLACHTIRQAAITYLRSEKCLPSDSLIEDWIDRARDRIIATALQRGMYPRDFAATLILSISNGRETVIAHVGDGSTVIRDQLSTEWIAPSWPSHGEYASTTNFLIDEPSIQLHITRHLGAIDGLVTFTDGIERLALDFAGKKPHAPFFNTLTRPVFQLTTPGRDYTLSQQLAHYLNTDTINQRTDDDKTIIIAAL
jgi:hypothetical protein